MLVAAVIVITSFALLLGALWGTRWGLSDNVEGLRAAR